MRLPKLRELKEAVTAVISPRFTTKFPAEPCVVPEKYRGKPEIDSDTCIGCGACVNVCPTRALTMVDETKSANPLRTITVRYDACIFCGNCHENCTTEKSIYLTNEWDLAGLDREAMVKTHDYELQLCENCGALIGTKKHLVWLYEKLGPLAYTNPSLLIAKSGELSTALQDINQLSEKGAQVSSFMQILCPKCKCELNIQL
ncbi:MAG: 4Fe-4S binding protein [Sedimentisphaerales bacterium]|nr:4Fe-4S binding protein [Sedimentisphaerales bacterium]